MHRRNLMNCRNKLVLESLDARVLLSAHGSPFEDAADFDVSAPQPLGAGVIDMFYADPEGWQDRDAALSVSEQIAAWDAAVLEEYNEQLGQVGLASVSADATVDSVADAAPWLASGGAAGSVLYLDFAGGPVDYRAGDLWLGAYTVDIEAYDLSMFGWGGSEAESINYIMQFVREDYAAYDIEVTNVEPTSGEYTTIYVGGDNDWFTPGNTIGVATYDANNNDASNYGFAFTEELSLYYNNSGGSLLTFSEYVANLITHESAHTYGANHADDPSALMNPYLAINPVKSMFGAANMPGSGVVQDTQSLLGTNLGYAGSADDHGDDAGGATSIDLSEVINGILERRDDADAFGFTVAGNGQVTIDLDTTVYGNLDSQITVYRTSDMSVVAQNDDDGMTDDSYVTFDAVAGTEYCLRVTSAGTNSSGTYQLSFSAPASAPTPSAGVTENVGTTTDSQMDFGSVWVGDAVSGVITISNSGSGDLVLSELVSTGGFQLDSSSAAGDGSDDITITPGGSLDVQVSLDTSQAGVYDGIVRIVTNDTNNAEITIDLSATAAALQGEIDFAGDLTSGTLDFGSVVCGDTGLATLTLRNEGNDALQISDIDLTGAFVVGSGFDGSAFEIAPGATRDIIVSVNPTSRGALTGTVTIVSDDADEGSVDIDISAQAVGGVLTVSETAQTSNDGAVSFGTLYVGQNASEIVTLTNTGDADLTISAILADAGFGVDIACTSGNGGDDIALAPGQSQSVTVQYAPTGSGTTSGLLTISSDAPQNAVQTVSLTGTATPVPTPDIDVTENVGTTTDLQVDFGSVWVGDTTSGVITIRNYGSADLVLSELISTGGFQISSSSAAGDGSDDITIASGGSLNVQVSLNAAPAGVYNGTVSIASNDGDEASITVSLAAVIAVPLPEIDLAGDLTSGVLDFGSVLCGDTGLATLTLRNNGNGVLEVSSIGLVGDFVLVSGFSGTAINVVPGATHDVVVSVDPSARGEVSGTVTIVSNDADESNVDVAVAAQAVAGVLTVSSETINFGTLYVGGSTSQTVILINTGDVDLSISAIVANAGFGIDIVCAAGNSADDILLAAGQSQPVTIQYAPTAEGSINGLLTISSDAWEDAVQTVSLAGTATPVPVPDIDASDNVGATTDSLMDFGSVWVGDTISGVITIRNNGLADLVLSELASTGGFQLDSSSAAGDSSDDITIAPGGSLDVQVSLDAVEAGVHDGIVRIVSNDSDEGELTIDLSATAVAAQPEIGFDGDLTDGVLDTGSVLCGDTGVATLTLRNDGSGVLEVSNIDLAGDFILVSGFDGSAVNIVPGATHDIVVSTSSASRGDLSGTVTIASNDTDEGTTVIGVVGQVIGGVSITESDGVNDGAANLGAVDVTDDTSFAVYQVTNNSAGSATVNLSLANGTAFTIVGAADILLASGETCSVQVAAAGATPVDLTDTLKVNVSGSDTLSVDLAIAADGYLPLQAGQIRSFKSQNGDNVTVVLYGSANAELRLGGDGQPDIESIRFVGGTSGSLSILNQGAPITLGDITGSIDFAINAYNASFVGDLDVDGYVSQFSVGAIASDATLSCRVDATASLIMRVGQISGTPVIDINGPLRMLLVDEFTGGTLVTQSVGYMLLGENFGGDIAITDGDVRYSILRSGDWSGSLAVNGQVGSVTLLNGDMSGTIMATGNVGNVLCFRGDITGEVTSQAVLASVSALEVSPTNIFAANTVDRLCMQGDLVDRIIGVSDSQPEGGYSVAGSAAVESRSLSLGGRSVNGATATGVRTDVVDSTFLDDVTVSVS